MYIESVVPGAQALPEAGFIGNRQMGAGLNPAVAVGADQGGIDAVQRGAAHQAKGGGHRHGTRGSRIGGRGCAPCRCSRRKQGEAVME